MVWILKGWQRNILHLYSTHFSVTEIVESSCVGVSPFLVFTKLTIGKKSRKLRHLNSIWREGNDSKDEEYRDKSEEVGVGNSYWLTYSSLNQIRKEFCFEEAAFMNGMSSEKDSTEKLAEQCYFSKFYTWKMTNFSYFILLCFYLCKYRIYYFL